MSSWVSTKLAEYKAQHRDSINQTLHVLGIPTIILALFILGTIHKPLLFVLFALGCAYPFVAGIIRGLGTSAIIFGLYWVAVNGEEAIYAYWLVAKMIVFIVLLCITIHRRSTVSKNLILGRVLVLLAMALSVLFEAYLLYLVEVSSLGIFFTLFVIGWIYHIPGHLLFERNKPAFTQSAVQILIAPIELTEVIAKGITKPFTFFKRS